MKGLLALDISKMFTRRRWADRVFVFCALAALFVALGTLAALLVDILMDGFTRLSWDFLTNYPSRRPQRAGILSALVGTLCMITLTALIAFPLGVGAAVYLQEYSTKNRFYRLVEINIANLAGVPSIVYGLLGLEIFVRMMGLGRSILAGAMTMALLILPIIILASREALQAVPNSIREGSYALGASRWQTIRQQVLPLAFPGILTGAILALSRAIGETAPLIMVGALTYVAFLPDSLSSPFTVLPIQIFNWVSRPQHAFSINAAARIIVLLIVLLAMNIVAVWLRNHFQKKLRW